MPGENRVATFLLCHLRHEYGSEVEDGEGPGKDPTQPGSCGQ